MRCFAVLFLILAAICGCWKKDEAVTFIVVNGVPITEAWVRDTVLIESRMAELSGHPIDEKQFASWANARAMKMVGLIANNVLLDQEIERSSIQVSPEDVAKTLASYNRRTGKTASSVEELMPYFGDLAPKFRRQFEATVRATAYERQRWQVRLTEKAVDVFLAGLSNDFHRVAEIDAKAWEKARAAHKRLKAGEAWEKVAAACSEDKLVSSTRERYAKEWTWVNGDAMGIPSLSEALPTLKKGDFTEPFESVEGLQIVRLVEKNKTLYKLARIFFRLAQPVHLPESREKARQTVERRFLEKRRAETLERLQKQAKFSYPMGTNFAYQIWKDQEKKGPEGQ